MKTGFKIVDSFLFSEPYEKEVMLLKFMLEDQGIAEWIILENAYSFQGSYTGLHVRKIIDEDERFEPFRHKITIIEKEKKTKVLPKHEFLDSYSYEVECWQRDLAQPYFMEKYGEEDWIMVSDIDEMIDFTSVERKNELYEKMEGCGGLLVVPTKRFWYDFDNEYKVLIGNAMCNKKYLLNENKSLHNIRKEYRRVISKTWRKIVAFEFSSCYKTDYIVQKFYTGLHTGFTENDLKQSLRCNHRPTRELASWKADNSPYWFFETVVLTENNSPKIIRDNLQKYKTNNVDINYRENRKKDYPELFSTSYFVKRWMKQKRYFLTKKLKAVRFKLANALNKSGLINRISVNER